MYKSMLPTLIAFIASFVMLAILALDTGSLLS